MANLLLWFELTLLSFSEGYENLARLRREDPSESAGQGLSGLTDTGIGPSGSVNPSGDSFDMFADDDENAAAKPSSDGVEQPLSNTSNTNSESKYLFHLKVNIFVLFHLLIK